MSPGMLIAEVTMFEDIKYPATTEAMIDCEVLMINKKAFMENFFGNVNLLQSIIKSLSMKVTYLMNSLEVETSIGTDLKIAKFIINHEETIGNIKHKDIAYELNTTSETVSRIKTNPIIIKNLHGLKVLCN
jgi:CRP-like cAMP-binding protein